MNTYIPEKIRCLTEYVPNENEDKCVIRLDANESPFRPSEKILTQFGDKIKTLDINRYPDPYAKEAVKKFADIHEITPENVIAGNGSDELISIICNSFLSKDAKILCVFPDFSMYAFYSEMIEADIIRYDKPDNYKINFGELSEIIKTSGIKLVILSNPCNPTGVAYDSGAIIDFVKNNDCLTVIDEAYMDYCIRDCSVLKEYKNHDNLIILKTMSKLGYAGLRIGFAIAGMPLIGALRKVKSPYNVNMASQTLAGIVFDNYDEVKMNIADIIKTREMLYAEISALKDKGGYEIQKPDGNFISVFFKDEKQAGVIHGNLLSTGISIRYMKPYRLRVTCGTYEETRKFIEEFKKLL